MRRTRGCLGNTPIFLAVCKKSSRRFLCTGDAGHGPPGSTHSYPDWAAFPAAFFIAYGRPNHERSSPPLLTVLLLLTGEHLEEVGGVKNERDGTSGVWAPRGSFFALHSEQIRLYPLLCLSFFNDATSNLLMTKAHEQVMPIAGFTLFSQLTAATQTDCKHWTQDGDSDMS